MFSWSRIQIKEHGLIDAARLIYRVAWSRAKVGLANRFLSHTLVCPCCGWSGRKFYDYIEVGYKISNTACPQCDSHPRHRAFYLWLQNEFTLQDKKGIALVCAPERSLSPLWETAPHLRPIRVDVAPSRSVDLLANLESLPFATSSIDMVWCHHVLEHVEHDRVAIGELYRVLCPRTGELLVSVPTEPGTMTREYGFANKRESGHWRMYGDDFPERLMESGFDAQSVNYAPSQDDCRKYGITQERFYICRKNQIAGAIKV